MNDSGLYARLLKGRTTASSDGLEGAAERGKRSSAGCLDHASGSPRGACLSLMFWALLNSEIYSRSPKASWLARPLGPGKRIGEVLPALWSSSALEPRNELHGC